MTERVKVRANYRGYDPSTKTNFVGTRTSTMDIDTQHPDIEDIGIELIGEQVHHGKEELISGSVVNMRGEVLAQIGEL